MTVFPAFGEKNSYMTEEALAFHEIMSNMSKHKYEENFDGRSGNVQFDPEAVLTFSGLIAAQRNRPLLLMLKLSHSSPLFCVKFQAG